MLTEREVAMDWFAREWGFAVDSHELTTELVGRINGVFVGDWPKEIHGTFRPTVTFSNHPAEVYEQAAQAIACYRRTCGHEHDPFTGQPIIEDAEGRRIQ
jgi:hypothetical protein